MILNFAKMTAPACVYEKTQFGLPSTHPSSFFGISKISPMEYSRDFSVVSLFI